jgi:hypothetical protein
MSYAFFICALMIRGEPCAIVVLAVSSLVHRRLLAVGTTAVGIVGIEPEWRETSPPGAMGEPTAERDTVAMRRECCDASCRSSPRTASAPDASSAR